MSGKITRIPKLIPGGDVVRWADTVTSLHAYQPAEVSWVVAGGGSINTQKASVYMNISQALIELIFSTTFNVVGTVSSVTMRFEIRQEMVLKEVRRPLIGLSNSLYSGLVTIDNPLASIRLSKVGANFDTGANGFHDSLIIIR